MKSRWDPAELSCFNPGVERVAHIAKSFASAREWDLEQYRNMTAEERQRVAKTLRERYYGKRCPDVRDAVAGIKRRT